MSHSSQNHQPTRFDLRVLIRIEDTLERRIVHGMLKQLGCRTSDDEDSKFFSKHNSDFDLIVTTFDRENVVGSRLLLSPGPPTAGAGDSWRDIVAVRSGDDLYLPRPVRLRDLERALAEFAASHLADDEPESFASMLDPAIVRDSARQLAQELHAFLEFPALERPQEGARKAHAFISIAVVLELSTLARACQNFEAAAFERGDCRHALGQLTDEIHKALVALRRRT